MEFLITQVHRSELETLKGKGEWISKDTKSCSCSLPSIPSAANLPQLHLLQEECSKGGSLPWWLRAEFRAGLAMITSAPGSDLDQYNFPTHPKSTISLVGTKRAEQEHNRQISEPWYGFLPSQQDYFISWLIITVEGIHHKAEWANGSDPSIPMGYLQANWPQSLQIYAP